MARVPRLANEHELTVSFDSGIGPERRAEYWVHMTFSEALSILEELGSDEPTKPVEPNEIDAALGVLRAEFSGLEERKRVSFIVTCSEHLRKSNAAGGWAGSYEREAWNIALLQVLDQLRVAKHKARWVFKCQGTDIALVE